MTAHPQPSRSTGARTRPPLGAYLSRGVSFWLLAVLLSSLLFAASAPSPLYAVYQAKWHFSPVTLTAIYAVYALGALVALLVSGRLPDHVGRRRVTAMGLVVQLAAMLSFVAAQGVAWLYLARLLQGVGTGLATGAISAWLLDLQPPGNRKLGSLVGGIALTAGLAAGALASGLLAQYGPDPFHLVFWLLAFAYVAALVTLPFVRDEAERRPGWLASLRPRIGVPPAARAMFAASFPSLVATWAIAGLYLSLGPSLAVSLMHASSRVAGGLVIMALLGTGAVASYVVREVEPGLAVIRGSLVLIVGLTATLLAVVAGSVVGLYAGSFVAGLGFGPAFSGVFRSVVPLAPPERRGALLAAVYLVVYVAFSVPAVLAGLAVTTFGLRNTTYVFGLIAMVLAAITTVAISRRAAGLAVTSVPVEVVQDRPS